MLADVQNVCQMVRDKLEPTHGNRKLHDDQVMGLLLCAFYEPLARSQRVLDQLSEVPDVQQLCGVDRIPRSTLSDALERFDCQAVEKTIRILARKLPELKHRDPELEEVFTRIFAADGSSFRLAGDVLWALRRRKTNGKVDSQAKLHLQLDVQRLTMEQVHVTGTSSAPGGASEQAVLQSNLQPGVLYLIDRGYCGFDLLREMLGNSNDFVLRLKSDWVFRRQISLPLTEEDRKQGVTSDELGYIGKADEDLSAWNGRGENRKDKPPEQMLRVVTVWDPVKKKPVRLLTNLRSLSAWMIGYLYRQRWLIEVFFRWLKITACFEHPLSQSLPGMRVQMYVAMISVLLIHRHTRRPVSKYALVAMSQVFSGRATLKQMLPGLLRLERQRQLERERLARKKAALAAQKAGK